MSTSDGNQSGVEHPTVARYRVLADSPPKLTMVIVVGDRVRAALMSKSDGASVFSGKTSEGKALRGHRHTHFIAESLGTTGAVDHITLFAPMGFNEAARGAIEELRELWGRHFDGRLQLALLGIGAPGDFAGANRRAGHCLAMHESRIWQSRTPFVPTRHGKRRKDGTKKLDDDGYWIGGARHDLRRLLMERGFSKPTRIKPLEHTLLGDEPTPWRAFRTRRPAGGGRKSTHRGFGFVVEFPEPVRGPICTGFGAHYGLGRFEPVIG